MKIKNWLIHKLGGKTSEDLLLSKPNYIEYRNFPVLTYKTTFTFSMNINIPEEEIKKRLASQFLAAIEENIDIEYIDLPNKYCRQYTGILKIIAKQKILDKLQKV